MTFLFAGGMLLILALIVVISAARSQRERNNLAAAAKMRSEMRKDSKDVWAATVPVTAVVHEEAPVEYDTIVREDDDMTDSQYQVLKAIFSETHAEFRTPSQLAEIEKNYWADTDHLGIPHD